MMRFTRHHVGVLIGQDMWRRIRDVHPALADCGRFVDWKKYRLGRLESEMRTEYIKSATLVQIKFL